MRDDAPGLSVVIPHRDDWDRLDRCVRAILAQRETVPGCEIIVVDNASRDRAMCDAFRARFGAEVVLVSEPRPGAACARNRGIAAARGTRVAFIDSDCLPAADWLREIDLGIAELGLCGGRVDLCFAGDRLSGAEVFEKVFAFRQDLYVRDKGFAVTANLGVRRDILRAVGDFRDGLSEDVDWCWRAADKGYPVGYRPAARVRHPARRNLAELRRKWHRVCREEVALDRVAGGRGARGWRKVALVAVSPFGHAPLVLACREVPLGARLRGVGALFHIRWYRVWRYAVELARPGAAAGPPAAALTARSGRGPWRR